MQSRIETIIGCKHASTRSVVLNSCAKCRRQADLIGIFDMLVNVFKMHCVHCVERIASMLHISMDMCDSNCIFDIKMWFCDWMSPILIDLNVQSASISVISKSLASKTVIASGVDACTGPPLNNFVNSMYLSSSWLHSAGCFKKLADSIDFCRFVVASIKLKCSKEHQMQCHAMAI